MATAQPTPTASTQPTATASSIVQPSSTASPSPTKKPTPTASASPTKQPAPTRRPSPTIIATPAPVVVGLARGTSVGEAVQRAVELAGGLGFIRPGQTVLVKPNVNSPDPFPATTNPEVLYQVVRLVWERDPARVIVADRSGYWGATLDFMQRVDIFQAALDAGAEVIPFDEGPWLKVKPQGADHWPQGFSIPQLVTQVDHIISLPAIKTHFLATFTMALKNWVGLTHPDDRTRVLHRYDREEPRFGRMIAELHLAVRPSFIVMDGTRAFVSGGPMQGEAVEPGLIVACGDPIANDVAGLAILKTLGTIEAIQGKSVWQQPQVQRAVGLGLGIADPSQMTLKAHNVPELSTIQQHLRGA